MTPKQLIQNYRTGELAEVEVPTPQVTDGSVLVCTRASLVSVGTERATIELARKNLLGKAIARRDLTRQVVQKARSEGAMEAWRQAMGRLDAPQPLGYSSAGVVVEVGAGVTGLSPGDRVACAGSGFAGHATDVLVPSNLCVRLPDELDFESGSFVALGGIALESIRMSGVRMGETVVVIGLGLVGLLTCQLLRASGCEVVGVDIDGAKVRLAGELDIGSVTDSYEAAASVTAERTENHGADAAIITAATPSSEPLEQAAGLVRERARIVATGLVGLEVPRGVFYDKELELVVSRAWGPGLYDPGYTERGVDYPIAYARWTARRNMSAFLHQVATGAVDTRALVTHRFPFDRAAEAYDLILGDSREAIGVVLTFADEASAEAVSRVWTGPAASTRATTGTVTLGVIGAGRFATGTLLPALANTDGVTLRGIASARGLSATLAADRFGFSYSCSEPAELLGDEHVDGVFILTRHRSHADLLSQALDAGKHVFVEKPLALDPEQLRGVVRARDRNPDRIVMVGFNRRYAPVTRWLASRIQALSGRTSIHCTVNAGRLQDDSWVHDPAEGGGRIVGEVCHFVDLVCALTGKAVRTAHAMGGAGGDNVSITLELDDGSVASILYTAEGDKRHPRERVEVFRDGSVGVIDNFRRASFTRKGRVERTRRRGVDRGHAAELTAFAEAIRTGTHPTDSLIDISTTAATFAIQDALRLATPQTIDLAPFFSPEVTDG